MDVIITQIRDLHAQATPQARAKIQEDLRDLLSSFESDWDLLLGMASGNLRMSLVKIGTDLSLFTTLSASDNPVSLSELVETTSAAPRMLTHLLRAMSSFGLIQQNSPTTFAANRTTHVLVGAHVKGAIMHVWDFHLPPTYALPAWLAERKYQDITTNKDLPFQKAMKTDLAPFIWMTQHPEQMAYMGHAMAIQRESSWVDSYPVPAALGTFTPAADSALLVDIGGGFGQQALALKKKFPELEGRVVVQDIPSTLKSAPTVPGLEFQEHDFFTEQPIKGAKFYYLRHVLHDWTDEDSVRILKAIVPAMGPESRIVIDEVVLLSEKLPWQAAYMDIAMMTCLAGIERTKEEFETVLEASGLRLLEVHRYSDNLHNVIIAMPK